MALRRVTADRDSVAAGDDVSPHQATFEIDSRATIADLLAEARRACPLASIIGGRATWLVDTMGRGRGCVGVVAQQWAAPRLLIPERTAIAALYGDAEVTVYFRYRGQADPAGVFEALRSGREPPSRHGR